MQATNLIALYLVVMRRQLVKQLFEAIFFPSAVYVRDLFLWQGVVILMHLKILTREQNVAKTKIYENKTNFCAPW